MQNNRISAFWAVLYCSLLVLYSYLEITALDTATFASPLLATSKIAIIIIAIYVVALRGQFSYSNALTRFWSLWITWLIVEFTILFNSGSGYGCLHSFFAPSCFFLVYYLCLLNPLSEKKLVQGFIILYLLTGAYSVYLSFYIGTVYWETGKLVSNLVFWPLCAFVFVPIVKKQLLQYFLLVPMIIISLLLAKRSAMIIIVLEVLVYSFYQLKYAQKRVRGNKRSDIFLYLIVGTIAVGIISSKFSTFTESTFSRFETMQDDQGSGRVEVYQSAISKIENFSSFDILFGRGSGSIVEIGNSAAHNDALQFFYEFGFVGFSLYLAFIIILLRRIRIIRNYAMDYYVGYLFCVITAIILGLFSNLVAFNSYFAFICSYLGVAEAAVYRRIHQINDGKNA